MLIWCANYQFVPEYYKIPGCIVYAQVLWGSVWTKLEGGGILGGFVGHGTSVCERQNLRVKTNPNQNRPDRRSARREGDCRPLT